MESSLAVLSRISLPLGYLFGVFGGCGGEGGNSIVFAQKGRIPSYLLSFLGYFLLGLSLKQYIARF